MQVLFWTFPSPFKTLWQFISESTSDYDTSLYAYQQSYSTLTYFIAQIADYGFPKSILAANLVVVAERREWTKKGIKLTALSNSNMKHLLTSSFVGLQPQRSRLEVKSENLVYV